MGEKGEEEMKKYLYMYKKEKKKNRSPREPVLVAPLP